MALSVDKLSLLKELGSDALCMCGTVSAATLQGNRAKLERSKRGVARGGWLTLMTPQQAAVVEEYTMGPTGDIVAALHHGLESRPQAIELARVLACLYQLAEFWQQRSDLGMRPAGGEARVRFDQRIVYLTARIGTELHRLASTYNHLIGPRLNEQRIGDPLDLTTAEPEQRPELNWQRTAI